MISFKANLVQHDSVRQYVIKPVKVNQSAKTGRPVNTIGYELKVNKYPVSFVELNPFEKEDQNAMKRVEKIWRPNGKNGNIIKNKKWVKSINNTPFVASMFQYTGESTNDVKSRFFALTCQNENFNLLNPEHFLGIAQVTKLDNGNISLDALQVNPFYLFNNPYSDIKLAGMTLMKQITALFAKNDFELFIPNSVIPFFELCGFDITKSNASKKEVFMTLKQNVSGVLK